MRWLVYYLKEDLVEPAMAAGADILDFSAGLGDLSAYMVSQGARSVVASRPEAEPGEEHHGVEWVTGVATGNVAEKLGGRSFDLVVARMVFQFPTWEGDRADPDTMLEEFSNVLRPGGRLVAAFHEFVPLEGRPREQSLPDPARLVDANPDLGSLVEYLNLPPREGPLGQTGFGLKVPMFVDSLVAKGFAVERADNPEPFTFPIALGGKSDREIIELGEQVMEMKARLLANVPDRYERPSRIRQLLVELDKVMPHVAWPIARVIARRM
jgi:SAM-dependent methyltransferase